MLQTQVILTTIIELVRGREDGGPGPLLSTTDRFEETNLRVQFGETPFLKKVIFECIALVL